jgi:hypothetical protein
MRIDTVNHIFGLRLNVWTSIVLFVLATAYFVIVGRRHPGREPQIENYFPRRPADETAVDDADEAAADDAIVEGDEAEDADEADAATSSSEEPSQSTHDRTD